MNHFKALLEKNKQDNAAKLLKELKELKKPDDEGKKKERPQEREDNLDGEFQEERRRSNDRGNRYYDVYLFITILLVLYF